MTTEGFLVVGLLLAAFVAMARAWLVPELAMLAVLGVLLAAGVVDTKAALAGFAARELHTVALLLVVSAALERSGALNLVSRHLLGEPRSDRGAQLRLLTPAALMSAFLNNTAVVALLLPVVRGWARRHRIAPSRLLIPLSYVSILGGVCTLIGTSTNLVARALLPEPLQERFGMFTIGAVGLPAALVGLVILIALGRKLLPERNLETVFSDPRTFTTEVLVDAGGPLVGRRLAEVQRPDQPALYPVEIERAGALIPAPTGDTVLQAGDRLVLSGAGAATVALHRVPGLTPAVDRTFASAGEGRQARALYELVIAQRCPLVGHRVGDGSFRRHYGAAVLAVARHGETVKPGGLGGWTLEAGDIVLVEAEPRFGERAAAQPDFIVLRDHEPEPPIARWQALAGLCALVVAVALAATGVLSMFAAVALAAAVVLCLRIVTWPQAVAALDARILLTIAAALGVGQAVESAGVARAVGLGLQSLDVGSPRVALAILYVATVIVTEVVTNNAAAVVMIPLALATASAFGVSAMPFVIAVTIGASAGFLSPIGYQTHLMVYGPGGYRFGDFVRMGLPVSIGVGIVTVLVTPIVFPF